jgi:CheY-like chemotaxis protein
VQVGGNHMARILVVDDDPDILKLAEKVLGSAGHTVFVAEDALRAVDWLNTIEFDLLLSDANMPHYSGFELVNTVRKNEKFKHMSVAMLTGLRERKDVERAVKAGVDDYIVKPIDPILLIEKVRALFDRKPPSQYPEIKLEGSQSRATMDWPVTVQAVSELGVRIICEFPLKPGMVIDIQAEFFRALDVEAPPMKVLSVEVDPGSDMYMAQLIFLGAREAFLQKIRKWLFTHFGSQRDEY